MKDSERVSPEFDQFARAYSELLEDPMKDEFSRDPLHFHRRKWLLLARLLKRSGLTPESQRWLDVGCGQGHLLELAGKNFREAVGCDPSAEMLAAHSLYSVRKQLSPVALPFDDKSIDLVTAICVYHHVHGTDRTGLTREIARVLKPGGLCCVIEHNPWNPVTRAIVKRCTVDVDAELLTAPELSSIFKACDFEHLSTTYFLYFPEWLFNRVGTLEVALSKLPLGGQYALLARLPSNISNFSQ